MAALKGTDREDRTWDKTPVQHYNDNTEALKRVNGKITKLCDRFPLKEQRDVTELSRLMEEQERLIRVRIKGRVPVRTETLNDNEKHRAHRLQRRFREARKRGKVRA